MKTEVSKLDIDKLINVPSGLDSLKCKVDDLDGDKLKTVPGDLKKLSNVVDKDVKKAEYIKLNSKVNRLQVKILVTFSLIHIH